MQNPAASILDKIRDIPVSEIETDGRLSTGDKVRLDLARAYPSGGRGFAEGTVRTMRQARGSTFVVADTAAGTGYYLRAEAVEPDAGWRERVDPCVAEGFGTGHGPLPILTHPDSGPHVEVSWQDGSVLLLGVYTTDRTGIVYRFDNGLEAEPTIIHWDLDGPPCDCEDGS